MQAGGAGTDALDQGRLAIVVCPAQLKDNWEKRIAATRLPAQVFSYNQIASDESGRNQPVFQLLQTQPQRPGGAVCRLAGPASRGAGVGT